MKNRRRGAVVIFLILGLFGAMVFTLAMQAHHEHKSDQQTDEDSGANG